MHHSKRQRDAREDEWRIRKLYRGRQKEEKGVEGRIRTQAVHEMLLTVFLLQPDLLYFKSLASECNSVTQLSCPQPQTVGFFPTVIRQNVLIRNHFIAEFTRQYFYQII